MNKLHRVEFNYLLYEEMIDERYFATYMVTLNKTHFLLSLLNLINLISLQLLLTDLTRCHTPNDPHASADRTHPALLRKAESGTKVDPMAQVKVSTSLTCPIIRQLLVNTFLRVCKDPPFDRDIPDSKYPAKENIHQTSNEPRQLSIFQQ